MIPGIAFTVPDLDGQARLELKNQEGKDVACIQSSVSNGKTMSYPAVSYVTAGIAASAFLLSASTAMVNGGMPGAAIASPTFLEVMGFFQGVASNGMLSVAYPRVYQRFTQNFGFSMGLVGWGPLQNSIDSFRANTGGNLTEDSYPYLLNAVLVGTNNGSSTGASLFRRALSVIAPRDLAASVNGTEVVKDGSVNANTTADQSKSMHYVSGVQAYVEELMVPQANTFMTVLLIFAIIVAAITVLILLTKAILELVALVSTLPRSLESWRKRYWWRLSKAITNLILILYGTWTLYCVYQFTEGDSWAAKLLAAVTWAMFTGLLGFFGFKIWRVARMTKKMDGDVSKLYDDKETWMKYSLFYDSFKKGYWWLFIPAIVYMFARNVVIAAGNGHGMAQAIGQIIVEVIFLALLIWSRPYSLKSGNVINIVISVVRVLSVICILVFVEELGMSQTTKTITGVALIVVQSVLTGVLAILIAVNAIIACARENPHRKRRKEAEKMSRDTDDLTPLDARNSLLLDTRSFKSDHRADSLNDYKMPLASPTSIYAEDERGHYGSLHSRNISPMGGGGFFGGRTASGQGNESTEKLIKKAPAVTAHERQISQSPRKPKLPPISLPEMKFSK